MRRCLCIIVAYSVIAFDVLGMVVIAQHILSLGGF